MSAQRNHSRRTARLERGVFQLLEGSSRRQPRTCSSCPAASAAQPTCRSLSATSGASELRWAQRLAGLPVTPREEMPAGPLDALFDLHIQADADLSRSCSPIPTQNWSDTLHPGFRLAAAGGANRLPAQRSRRMRSSTASAIGRSLATLVRSAGFPSDFKGDLLFSPGAAQLGPDWLRR